MKAADSIKRKVSEKMPKRRGDRGLGKLKRIVHLLSMIDSSQPRTAAEIAQAMGVSRRTVYRDLAALEQCGVPALFEDAVHGYTLAYPTTCRLKVDELLCLLIAAHAVQIRAAPRFRRLLRQGCSKLAKLLPDPDRSALKRLTKVIGEPIRNSPRRQEDHLLTILRAVEHNKALHVDYEDSSSGPKRAKLHLVALRTSSVQWELIGKFDGERHYRRISLERIRAAELDA